MNKLENLSYLFDDFKMNKVKEIHKNNIKINHLKLDNGITKRKN